VHLTCPHLLLLLSVQHFVLHLAAELQAPEEVRHTPHSHLAQPASHLMISHLTAQELQDKTHAQTARVGWSKRHQHKTCLALAANSASWCAGYSLLEARGLHHASACRPAQTHYVHLTASGCGRHCSLTLCQQDSPAPAPGPAYSSAASTRPWGAFTRLEA
jgi:hypothetical protein